MVNKYKKYLLKKDDEKVQDEDMPLSNRFPDHWIIIDSAYQSADQYLRAVVKKKKKFIKTSADNAYYRSLSKDRVVCEIFYGRLLTLFRVIRNK
jgi:predicted N-acyltransferase